MKLKTVFAKFILERKEEIMNNTKKFTRIMSLLLVVVMAVSTFALVDWSMLAKDVAEPTADSSDFGTTDDSTSDLATTRPKPQVIVPGAATASNYVAPTVSTSVGATYTLYRKSLSGKVDGVLDAAYYDGIHLQGSTNSSATGTTFDVYMVYGSDNLLHIYCEIHDKDIVSRKDLYTFKNWHNESMDIYINKTGTANNIFHVIAPNSDNLAVPSEKWSPKAVYKSLTPTGWMFEATIGSDASNTTFSNGSSMTVGFYLNDPYNFTSATDGGYSKATISNMASTSPNSDTASQTTLKFSTGTAPSQATNATTVLGAVKSGKTAIVIPTDASYAVKADANNVKAALSNATVITEGTSTSGYTYVIYVGHVNSASITKSMVDTIGYNGYGVGVVGNAISIFGSTEEMLNAAVDVFKKEVSGSLTKKPLYSGTCAEWVGGEDLPYLPGATLVSDSGYGVYAIGKKGADAEHFATYKNGLAAMGYTLVQSSTKGNFQSATYKNSDNIVTVNYGQYFKNSLSYNVAGDISTTVYGMMVMVNDADSYSTELLESSLTYPTTYQPILSLYNRNQIIRLANGEFLIIDSSNQGGTDTANIISELIALSPNGKPVVAAWYFSHFHQDHNGGFATLAKSNEFKSIQVKSVIFNFCSEQVVDTASDGDMGNMSVWIDCIENVQAAGGKIYYSHAGQTFNFPGAKLEVLRTYEDIMPFRFDEGTNGTGRSNPTNQIAKVTVYKNSTTSQTIMFCGDSSVEEFSLDTIRYGSYLESDIVQLAHHGGGDYGQYGSASGSTGYTKANAFYNTYVKAKYAVVAKVGSRSCSPAEAAAVSAATETFYTNTAADNSVGQIVRVPIPYSGTAASLTITPTLGTFDTTIYDKSATGSTNSDNGITANPNASAVTAPSGINEESRYVYTANTVYTNITTDGVMDPAYTYGIHLKSTHVNNTTQNNSYPISFDAYIVGGQDGKIHVYATVYDSARYVGAYIQEWRQDCFDFWYYNFTTNSSTGNVRFAAKSSTKVGDTTTQSSCNMTIPTLFQDFYVVSTSTQYSVEFSFNNNGTAFKDGDQIAFGCYINSIDTHSGYGNNEHTNHCAMVATNWSNVRNAYMNPNNGYQQFANLLTFSTESATKAAGASDRTSGADALLPVNPGYDTVQESVSNRGKNTNLPKLDSNLGGTTLQNVYGMNTAYATPTMDGEMDNIYTYGLHLEDKYSDNLVKYAYAKEKQNVSIDAYMVFCEDGNLHVFIKVVDAFVTNSPTTQWHRDGIDFYYDFGNDGGGWSGWNFGFEATQPTTKQPNNDFVVKKQSDGYTVEFYFNNNGKAFQMGDEFGFGIFYNNCIAFADNSAANTMTITQNTDGTFTLGTTSYAKHTIMTGSYMSDMIGSYLSPQQGGQANSADAVKLISNNAMAGYFFDYGDGSAKYPYEINDKADFDRYVNTVLGDYGRLDLSAKLNTNITLNTGLTSGGYVNDGTFTQWTPIGSSSEPFTGTIDGNGKTISGLYIDGDTDYAGFIAYNKGTIKNLNFADSYVKGNNYVGGIAGRNEGTLTNCAYNGTVIGKTNVGTDKAGYASTVYEVSFKSTGSYDYGWVYFVPSGTKLTNFEFMEFTGTAVPETITKNYANTPINAVITSAQAALGEDISIIFNVYLGTGNDNAFMRFTLAGEEKTAQAVAVGNGYYTFTFKGVSPEYMGDTLLAELVNGETVIAKVSTFTFENYAKDLIAKTDAELIALGIASNKTAALRTLLKDMLVYGGEAQKYFGYNTSDLVSSGITGSSFTKPTSTDKNVGTSTSATTKFSGATLNISYDNRVRFDFVSTEVAKVTVKITIGGEDTMYVYGQNIIPNEDGSYSIYTPSLLATECDEVITATLYVDGVEVQTVTYSVKSYVYSMCTNANAGAIVKALYNYILAAEAYVK